MKKLLKYVSINAKIILNFLKRGAETSRKNTTARRRWQEGQNRKNEKLQRKKNTSNAVPRSTRYTYATKSERTRGRLTAPKVFSICENADEVVDYFAKYITKAKVPNIYKSLFCDMRKVEHITADAIMYLVATLENVRAISQNASSKACYITGNAPACEAARMTLLNSGFPAYVNSSFPEMRPSKEHFHIVSGNRVDPSVARKVCDQINYFCSTDIMFTRSLFTMIIEMMQNTVDHAYPQKSSGLPAHWYVAVENRDEFVRFVFLDTGEGIPSTIRKKITERIIRKDEYDYLVSAFRGDFRTNTGLRTRGKGLPTILQCVNRNGYQRLAVVSGKGYYVYDVDKKLHIGHDLNKMIQGTVFTFDVPKPTLRNEVTA